MLRVPTMLGVSSVHGIGLFSAAFIAKGTVTWVYDPEFDTSFSEGDIQRMPESAREFFFRYAYLDKELGRFVLCCDDQRFINHSTSSTNIQSSPRCDIAARDIHAGEELLCNYDCFDDTFLVRAGLVSLRQDLGSSQEVAETA